MDSKRHNIGIVVSSITDFFSNFVAKGAMSGAQKFDLNLFIFPAKYFGVDWKYGDGDSKYEYQYNALLYHAAAAKLDYVIVVLGTVAYALDYDHKRKLLKAFADTPVLSVASKIDGYDYLLFDNKTGIAKAVDHLAGDLGKRHIGILYGDLHNYECAERFEAYKAALAKYDIPFREEYCVASDISENIKSEAQQLIESNPALDAVLCVNDSMAKTLYTVLRNCNKFPGKDIAVVGFDDLPFAANLEPPLSSIKADAFTLGERAVEKAYLYLTGQKDDEHFVQTKFIPRQSTYGLSAEFFAAKKIFVGTHEEIARHICDYLYGDSEDKIKCQKTADFAVMLLTMIENALKKETAADEDIERIIEKINMFINDVGPIVNNVIKIHTVLDGGFMSLEKGCPKANLLVLRSIYTYFLKRVALGIAADYHDNEGRLKAITHFDNLVIRDTLMLDGNIKNGCSQILKRICAVGSDTSYVYLFKEPVAYYSGQVFPKDRDWYFKEYAYGETTFSVPQDEQKMSAHDIFTNKYINFERRHTMIAIDLYSNEYQYGMALCEPRSYDFFDEVELVTYQMSSIVKSIEMLKSREKMLTELHSQNLILKNMSTVDELTGLYNRRGFYSTAEDMIEKPENEGKSYIVCYADMDNLKMVNDSYGHIEGDFSLSALADCLRAIFGKKAVIGRTGGDEFVVLALKEDVGEIAKIQAHKDSVIEKLNIAAKKPYLINMSLGLYECTCSNSYDLKSAVDKADDLLYAAKAKRKKKI